MSAYLPFQCVRSPINKAFFVRCHDVRQCLVKTDMRVANLLATWPPLALAAASSGAAGHVQRARQLARPADRRRQIRSSQNIRAKRNFRGVCK